jgi:hypothetical protein
MAEESKPPQIVLADAIHLPQTFPGADLTQTTYQIQKSLKGASADGYAAAILVACLAEILFMAEKP